MCVRPLMLTFSSESLPVVRGELFLKILLWEVTASSVPSGGIGEHSIPHRYCVLSRWYIYFILLFIQLNITKAVEFKVLFNVSLAICSHARLGFPSFTLFQESYSPGRVRGPRGPVSQPTQGVAGACGEQGLLRRREGARRRRGAQEWPSRSL